MTDMKAAIDQGDDGAITAMLQQDAALRDEEFEWCDANGRRRRISPLRYAHACDQVACFKALSAAGADTAQFRLALWNNAYNMNLPQVQRLLDWGIDPNKGMAVAQTRIGPRRHDVIRALIAAGADFIEGPRMDLHQGHLDKLEQRLQEDPALVSEWLDDRHEATAATPSESDDPPQRGLLHMAAAHNDLAAIELLLRYGADIDRPVPDHADGTGGQTPIYFTIGRSQATGPSSPAGPGAYETCEAALSMLLERGVDLTVRARARFGGKPLEVTPLGYALACQNVVDQRTSRLEIEAASRETDLLRQHGAPA